MEISSMKTQKLLQTALVGALTIGVASITSTVANAAGDMKAGDMNMTKCYGINAAHKNAGRSPGLPCAGQATKANDPNPFVAVPAGLCEKIAGGSTPPAD